MPLEQCMCDPIAQDCPEGEKCVPTALGDTWDCNKCVQVLGEQAAGEDCWSEDRLSASDDCDASSWCFTDAGLGKCHAFCEGTYDDPQCASGFDCWIANQGTVPVCVPTCDPFLQDCEADSGCYWNGAIFGCVFVTDEKYNGEPCDAINGCSGGWHCTDQQVPGCEGDCCTQICDIKLVEELCPLGTECLSMFDEDAAPQGYEDVGICIVPP
jgi:hypothetical protein